MAICYSELTSITHITTYMMELGTCTLHYICLSGGVGGYAPLRVWLSRYACPPPPPPGRRELAACRLPAGGRPASYLTGLNMAESGQEIQPTWLKTED